MDTGRSKVQKKGLRSKCLREEEEVFSVCMGSG